VGSSTANDTYNCTASPFASSVLKQKRFVISQQVKQACEASNGKSHKSVALEI